MFRRGPKVKSEIVTTQDMGDGVSLVTYKITSLVRVPKRVWQVHIVETGEVRECRRLRPLLYEIYFPHWYRMLVMDVQDFLYDLRHGFECSECGDEYRVFHTCQVNGR